MIFLRPSGMPLAFLCAGSLQEPEIKVREKSEDGNPADLGSATHEALETLVRTGAVDWTDMPRIAAKWRVSEDDLRGLVGAGVKLWALVSPSMPNPMAEVPLTAALSEGVALTGRLDVMSVSGDVAIVADFKTGREDADYQHQVKAYAYLVLADNPALREVKAAVLWLRETEVEWYTVTRGKAAEWRERALRRATGWDGTYHTGAHCGHCPRAHECKARDAMVRADVQSLTGIHVESALDAMTPAQLVEVHRMASTVADVAKRVKDKLKDIATRGGDIVSDGVRLTIREEERRSLDTINAWPVLMAEGFTDADLNRCVEVSPTEAEKVLAEKAERGHGARRIREFRKALDAANAVRVTTIRKLVKQRA